MTKHAATARALTVLTSVLLALCLLPAGAFAAVELTGNEEGPGVAAALDATGDGLGGTILGTQSAPQQSVPTSSAIELGSQATSSASPLLSSSPDSASSGQQLLAASDFQQTLPVVYLHIDGGQAKVDAMNASKGHSVHCTGTMDIVVPEGFSYADSTATLTSQTGLTFDIRGRGNTSWDADKKPYKIKLDKKASLLGMGRNKHWALLANAYDPTLVRNRITYWLGHEFGLAYTPSCYPVDVFMEGEYLGSYYLSETIRVDNNRVEIDELEEGDTDPDVITGGYLVQFLQDPGSASTFTTDKDVDLQNVSPNFDVEDGGYENDAQRDYIRTYIQEAEYAAHEREIADPNDPSGYRALDVRDYVDIDSAARYWLMSKLSANMDAYGTGSTYFYKTRDTDVPGKIFWGPLWDFDYAWDYAGEEAGVDNDYNRDTPLMVAMMTDHRDDSMPARVRALWPQLRSATMSIIEKDGLLDQYREELRVSRDQSKQQYKDEDGNLIDFDESIERLRKWIAARVDFMDALVKDIDHYACRACYKNDENDQHPRVYCYIAGESASDQIEAPQKDGQLFLGWFSEDGDKASEVPIDHDVTFLPRYISKEDATKVSSIYFLRDHMYVKRERGSIIPQYTLYPTDAIDQTVVWTSSDDSVATVDEEDQVNVRGLGTATITATLPTGATGSFQLTVVDKLLTPETVELERETIEMEVGDIQQARLSIVPEACAYEAFFSIDEETDVATCDGVGVVFAQKPGRVAGIAHVMYWDSEGMIHEKKLQFTVIVREAEKESGGEEEPDANKGQKDSEGNRNTSDGGNEKKNEASKTSVNGKDGKKAAAKKSSGSSAAGTQAVMSVQTATTGAQTASGNQAASTQPSRQDLAQTGDGSSVGVAFALTVVALVLLTVGGRMRRLS